MTVGGMGFIPERLLMMMITVLGIVNSSVLALGPGFRPIFIHSFNSSA